MGEVDERVGRREGDIVGETLGKGGRIIIAGLDRGSCRDEDYEFLSTSQYIIFKTTNSNIIKVMYGSTLSLRKEEEFG